MKYLCLAALLTGSLSVFAQKTIRGKIIDAVTDAPLTGATISSGGKGLTISGPDGTFVIPCTNNMKLIITSVGYETHQYSLKNCNEELLLALEPASRVLNEVEITATSSENKSILYQPQSLQRLTTTEIKRGTGLFLDDAINTNVLGVSMMRRTVAAGQQFNIRGYGNGVRGTNGPQSNFDTQGSKVYLNGIPITDAEGITLMDDIDFGSLGNVEIVKGPAGTLYGLAIAGVVNLKTVRPAAGATSLSQEAIIGNFGLRRFTTSLQRGGENSSLLLNYGYQQSSGFMTHTASEKRFVNAAGEFDINKKQTITFYAGHSNSYDQRGGELTIAQYNNGDYSGNPAYIKNNAHSHVTSFRGGVGHTYRFNNNFSNTTTVFGTAMATDVSSAGGWTDKNPLNYGVRSAFETRFVLGSSTLSGLTGIESQTQFAQTIAYPMGANPADPNGDNIITGIRTNQYAKSGTASYFTEWSLLLPFDLSFTAGVGSSNMSIELNDRIYAANKPSYFFKKYLGMMSPHVAVNKVFSKAVSLYAAYSKGYKAPVSSYFFIPFAAGVANTGIVNTNLKPEEGVQYEIGSKGALFSSRLSYQVAVFNALFKNKMAAVAVPNASNTATLYSYIVNSGQQNNKGLEALVRYTLVDQATGVVRFIRPFANVTYSDFKYDNYKFQFSGTAAPVDYSGKPVAGIAKIVANAGVDFQLLGGVYGNVVYNYKDPVYITLDGANRSSSYNLLNAKLGVKQSFSRFDLDVHFGINNITGVQYYYMIFVNQLPDAYLPAPRNPMYFGGLKLTYNF